MNPPPVNRSVAPSGDIALDPLDDNLTMPRLLLYWADRTPDAIAMREKDLGIWKCFTWREYRTRVCNFALGLLELGLGHPGRLAIASEDTPEWLIADMATQSLGGQTVGVYPTNPWPELQYVVGHSESTIVVCGDQEQVDKVLDAQRNEGGLPHVAKIICVDMKGLRQYARDQLLSFEEVEALGAAAAQRDPEAQPRWEAGVMALAADRTCILVYTSGTTGPPKGAQLSHRNLLFPTGAMVRQFGLRGENYSVVCYLPLCHVAEKIFSEVAHLQTGGVVNFAETIDTVEFNLLEIAPTVFLGVPRIWEKMRQRVLIRIKDGPRLQQRLFAWAMAQGERIVRRAEKNGGRHTLLDRLARRLLWLLMFRSLQRHIGMDHSIMRACGGASVSPETIRFFEILGLPVVQAYGMTESGGVSFIQDPANMVCGHVGRAIPGLSWRIAEDGELDVRGPSVFQGYFEDEAGTARVIEPDGWLHSGDIVEVAANGELKVIDRKKAIIVTAGGKNIAPSEIENALKDNVYIREAVVVGDGRHFLSALIQIDFETAGKWAQERALAYTNYKSLSQLPEIRDLVAEAIREVNERFARVENVRKFRILEKELDHDDGELTATQKVRRSAIEKKFAAEIALLYGEAA